MLKVLNIFFLILILTFSLTIFKYYFSNNNLKAKNFNRKNIDIIINKKILDLPILADDTNNVIIFNDSLLDDIENSKSRSFWNLLKSK